MPLLFPNLKGIFFSFSKIINEFLVNYSNRKYFDEQNIQCISERFFMFSKKIIKNLILFRLISKKIFQAQIKIAMKFSDFETKNQMVNLVDKIFNTRHKTQVSYAD